ncbi:MAG: hypothetical protein M1838_003892, partial [Thelocarpon superellum]
MTTVVDEPMSVEKAEVKGVVTHRVGVRAMIDPKGRSQDEMDLLHFGKRPQLKRSFGFFSMVGLTCTLMASWESIFSVFLDGFQNGGPAGLVYGFIFCWFGNLAVILSMAELSSMIPLSGGQYHWVACLAPQSQMKFLSYVTGWVTMLGWQTAVASLAYLGGTIIQGLIVLNYPDYNFQRWHGTLLFYAIIAVNVIGNTLLAKYLPVLEGIFLFLHVAGFLGVLIPLVRLAPHVPASDVFAQFLNQGGWSSDGLSFFVGIVTSVFAFIGADAACHLAEEIENAAVIVPWSMIATVIINGVLGFAILIAILFCIGDIDSALTTPTGYPFIAIFVQATNSNAGASAMTAIVVGVLILGSIGVLTTASRMLWAFARDNGVPASKYISRVDPSTKLPLYAIAVTTIISLLLALINIGSAVAFNALTSLVVAGFFSSYAISISLITIRRFYGEPIQWGPWNMGKFGLPVNLFAMVYIVIA